MRVLPVLDLQRGQVVRGVAGRRHEYRPIVSPLTSSSRPLDVAAALRDRFGLDELYLADLDAIHGQSPTWAIYEELHAQGFRLWVDAGVREPAEARALIQAGVAQVVIGLETVRGPQSLADALRQVGSERVVFSLDLRDGTPLGDLSGWGAAEAWPIAALAVALGVRRMIVLDLARVGVGGGIGTEELCRHLCSSYPDLEVIAGGGVRGLDDLLRLKQLGVQGALVASALHDGRLRPQELEAL
jgi:phosphoribosylformimino-5-aminoimidazole carboxamide ribotide isomerase